MSIIQNIGNKIVQIAGVVRASTLSSSKRVLLDIQIKTGNYFEIGRKGLRIDAPNFNSRKDFDAGSNPAPPVNAAYRSEGYAVRLLSEDARRSSAGHKGPLVFTILPELHEQERKASAKKIFRSNKTPDLAKRGRPADDKTLASLKKARLVYIFRLTIVLRALYRCCKSAKSPEHAIADAFTIAKLKMPIEDTVKKGAALEKLSDEACVPHLRQRSERKLSRHWLEMGDRDQLLNRAAELVDVLRLINKALSAYTRLAEGKRRTMQVLREGKRPSDEWVTEAMLGSREQQEADHLTFVEKMQLALYTGINPSDIWVDTVHLGDGAPEKELFHGATLVAELGAGRRVKATTEELRPLALALLRLPHALSQAKGGVTAKPMALAHVYVMLRSIAEERDFRDMLRQILEKEGAITITPMNVGSLRPLSSLRVKDNEFFISHCNDEPSYDELARQDDIYWLRDFWRTEPAEKKGAERKRK